MSTEVIKEFLVALGFSMDEAAFAKFRTSIAQATLSATGLAVGITAATAAIAAGVQHIASEYDKLDKLALRFRDTAEAIDEFADSAAIFGVGGDAALASLESLDRAVIDTSYGLGRAKVIFEALGISVRDVAGEIKPTTQVMGELAEKFKTMSRGQQLRVMERLGLDPGLLRVFNGDLAKVSAELAEIDKAANFDFGEALAQSKAFMASFRLFGQEIEKFKMLFGKAFESVAVKLMPKMRGQVERVTQSMVSFRRVIMDNMPRVVAAIVPIVQALLSIAEGFFRLAGRVATGAEKIISWLVKINDATDGWAGYILSAMAAWKLLNLSFLATPLGQLIALAGLVALLIDDFLTFKEGGDALLNWGGEFGFILKGVTGALTLLTGAMIIARAWTVLTTGATAIWASVTGGMAGVLGVVTGAQWLLNAAIFAFGAPFLIMVGLLIGAAALIILNWETVSKWFTGFFNWMVDGFKQLLNWGGKVSGMFTGKSLQAPGVQVQAAVAARNQNVNQNTNITVQGAADPAATARAVSGVQNRINADMARNMRGATQ